MKISEPILPFPEWQEILANISAGVPMLLLLSKETGVYWPAAIMGSTPPN